MQHHEETNFLNLLNEIMNKGQDRPDRTDVGMSRFLNGQSLSFDLTDNFPILTTRKVALRIAFEETMFFLRGQTDSKILEDKNIWIWNGNTTRTELDKNGLNHLPEGSIGKAYSHQWRNFGGDLNEKNGCDQIKEMLENMQKNPYSRRHLFSAWNPQQLPEMALPPCHLMNMYTITPDGYLNSSFIMRSTDVPFGLPYNIMSYALLNKIFAKYLNLIAGELTYFGQDVHVYENQFDMVKEWLNRKPNSAWDTAPELKINKDLNSFEDILNLQWEDLELLNYDPQPDIKNKPKMAV